MFENGTLVSNVWVSRQWAMQLTFISVVEGCCSPQLQSIIALWPVRNARSVVILPDAQVYRPLTILNLVAATFVY